MSEGIRLGGAGGWELNAIKSNKSQPKLSVRIRRPMAAWNHDYLASLLGGL